jgi:hypothetical protein
MAKFSINRSDGFFDAFWDRQRMSALRQEENNSI